MVVWGSPAVRPTSAVKGIANTHNGNARASNHGNDGRKQSGAESWPWRSSKSSQQTHKPTQVTATPPPPPPPPGASGRQNTAPGPSSQSSPHDASRHRLHSELRGTSHSPKPRPHLMVQRGGVQHTSHGATEDGSWNGQSHGRYTAPDDRQNRWKQHGQNHDRTGNVAKSNMFDGPHAAKGVAPPRHVAPPPSAASRPPKPPQPPPSPSAAPPPSPVPVPSATGSAHDARGSSQMSRLHDGSGATSHAAHAAASSTGGAARGGRAGKGGAARGGRGGKGGAARGGRGGRAKSAVRRLKVDVPSVVDKVRDFLAMAQEMGDSLSASNQAKASGATNHEQSRTPGAAAQAPSHFPVKSLLGKMPRRSVALPKPKPLLPGPAPSAAPNASASHASTTSSLGAQNRLAGQGIVVPPPVASGTAVASTTHVSPKQLPHQSPRQISQMSPVLPPQKRLRQTPPAPPPAPPSAPSAASTALRSASEPIKPTVNMPPPPPPAPPVAPVPAASGAGSAIRAHSRTPSLDKESLASADTSSRSRSRTPVRIEVDNATTRNRASYSTIRTWRGARRILHRAGPAQAGRPTHANAARDPSESCTRSAWSNAPSPKRLPPAPPAPPAPPLHPAALPSLPPAMRPPPAPPAPPTLPTSCASTVKPPAPPATIAMAPPPGEWRQEGNYRPPDSRHGDDSGNWNWKYSDGRSDDVRSTDGQDSQWRGGWGPRHNWRERSRSPWRGGQGACRLWTPAHRMKTKAIVMSTWFCQACNKECKTQERYEEHVAEFHVKCDEPGCSWSGPEASLAVHKFKHVRAADGSSVLDSPEELRAWIAARRGNFPCEATMKRKAEAEERRRQSGALEESTHISTLEKLLRQTHGLEGRRGKGKFGKGKGKGKDKGKGKGKDKGKGKGKFKGKKKGKGKSWQGVSFEANDQVLPEKIQYSHVSATLPLPSTLANCVPLEAPFGALKEPEQAVRVSYSRGPCVYFQRGYCYHGERCQFDHVLNTQAEDAHAAEAAASTVAVQWWVLPSTLANRACGAGEGPAGGHGNMSWIYKPRKMGPRVPDYEPPEERPRRDGLLRRLLQPEVDRYYSAILQCVRYVVATDFFRLEKAARDLPGAEDFRTAAATAASAPAPLALSAPASSSSSRPPAESEQDKESPVDLNDDELLELARALDV